MRPKMMVAVAAALGGAVAAGPAAAQRAEAGQAVREIMLFRGEHLADTTRLDACTVARTLGAGSLAGIDASVFDGPAEGCPRRRARNASAVLLDSVAVNDGLMHVHMTVVRGEFKHREHYTVHRWKSGEYRGVDGVRIWGAIQALLAPDEPAGSH